MSSWLRRTSVVAVLGLTACPVRYPIVTDAGFALVPPSKSEAPLGAGTTVMLVMGTPPGCRSIGLATGVGGVPDDQLYTHESAEGERYPQLRAKALIALRNAVGKSGGTHVRVDAEVRYTTKYGLAYVILRGSALVCG